MAAYSRIYVIGGSGGFLGADGPNPIALQIWVGEGNCQWLEAHYFDEPIQRLGKIATIIPERPCADEALLDACIAFVPEHFAGCPAMERVRSAVAGMTALDFSEPSSIPREWAELRDQARPLLDTLGIWCGDLRPLSAQPSIE